MPSDTVRFYSTLKKQATLITSFPIDKQDDAQTNVLCIRIARSNVPRHGIQLALKENKSNEEWGIEDRIWLSSRIDRNPSNSLSESEEKK